MPTEGISTAGASDPPRGLFSTAVGDAPAWFVRWLIGAVAVGVALRLGWVVAVQGITLDGPTDQAGYVRIGRAWADGAFATSSLRTPVLPALVAAAEVVTRVVPVSLRLLLGLLHTLAAAAMIVTVGLATRRWFGAAAGIAAAWVLAVWPNQVVGTAVIMTEVLAGPSMIAAVVLLLWNPPGVCPARRRHLSAAIAGVMVLTRPALLPVAGVLVLLAWRTPAEDGRRPAARAAAYLAIVVLVLGSWSVALSVRAGTPVASIGTAGDLNLCLGNNPVATGRWSDEANDRFCPWPVGADEFDKADELRSRAFEWARDNPGRQPGLVGSRLGWTLAQDSYWLDWYPSWDDYRGPGDRSTLSTWFDRWWWAVCALGVVGVGVGLRQNRRATAWLVAVAIAVVAAPAVTIGDPRFHDPLVPLMAVMAGAAISWSRRVLATTARRRAGATAHAAGRVRLPPSGGGRSTSTEIGGGPA